MVMSETYRQSSLAPPEVMQADPQNIWLACGPASRLSAEMIRDNALATSGLLVKDIGGKSVRPYQPKDIWRMNNMDYKQDSGEALYRRSMYTIHKRSAPPPNMMAFDAFAGAQYWCAAGNQHAFASTCLVERSANY